MAPYAGPVVLPREKTYTWPCEFTATPAVSPKYRSSGSLKKSGFESNGDFGHGLLRETERPPAAQNRAKVAVFMKQIVARYSGKQHGRVAVGARVRSTRHGPSCRPAPSPPGAPAIWRSIWKPVKTRLLSSCMANSGPPSAPC